MKRKSFIAAWAPRHRTTKVKSPQINGLVERFNCTVLDEFLRPKMITTYYESVENLQKDLNVWLKYYNLERTHQGYRSQGKGPIDTVKMFVKNARQEG